MNQAKADQARKKRDKRVRQVRRRQTKMLVVTFSLAVLISFSIYYIYDSPFWIIKKIEITGNDNIKTAEIIGSSGITSETTLLKFPRKKVEKRLRKNPWIDDLVFSRRLPSTLKIDVLEKEPVVAIEKDNRFYLIDKERYLIVSVSENFEYPTIEDLSVGKIKEGKRISSKALSEIILIIENLPPEIRMNVVSVSAPKISKIALYTKDNIEIVYGPAESMSKKNRVIDKILELKGNSIIYINVSIPDNPVTREL